MKEQSENDKSLKRLALREGWLSTIVNVLLFIAKYWVGVITGSVAIIADAWHTLSDSLSSIVLIIGVFFSGKPADRKHPFGHGRAELIAAVIIGVLLAMVCFELFREALVSLKNKEHVVFGLPAIIVVSLSVIIKEANARYAFYIARKTGMKSVKADAWHHRSDAISSLVILAGIFLGRYFQWIDGVLAILVCLLLAYATFQILKDAVSPLLGEKAKEEDILRIKSIANNLTDFDVNPHHILMHNYGSHTELTFHIKLPSGMNVEEAHSIATTIEKAIQQEMNISATIHIEPDTL